MYFVKGRTMAPLPNPVSVDLELQLMVPGSTPLPVMAGIRYDAGDPYAVHVGFRTGGGLDAVDVVEWTFARQLLTDGVAGPVGDGDVQVWPSRIGPAAVVCLSLCSPSGKALFEVPLGELIEFLTQTYLAVPTGSESRFVDLDAELALLMWSEPEL